MIGSERPIEPAFWQCLNCERGTCKCLAKHQCNYQDAADCHEFCKDGECRKDSWSEFEACCACECGCDLPSACYAAKDSPDHECECGWL